jgi:hypothetical protein
MGAYGASAAECWYQYCQAERRLDRAKEANDPAATSIARSQATRWLNEWVHADERDARASRGLDGPTAMIIRAS